jgi:hypothetical protein
MRGRPPKWQDAIDPAWEYVDGQFVNEGDLIPSVAGLAVYVGCARETVHAWAREHEEFSHILSKMLAKQEKLLAANGLSGEYNAAITKLLLSKHGYSEKTETALTGVDGGPILISEVVRKVVDA